MLATNIRYVLDQSAPETDDTKKKKIFDLLALSLFEGSVSQDMEHILYTLLVIFGPNCSPSVMTKTICVDISYCNNYAEKSTISEAQFQPDTPWGCQHAKSKREQLLLARQTPLKTLWNFKMIPRAPLYRIQTLGWNLKSEIWWASDLHLAQGLHCDCNLCSQAREAG